MAIPFLSDISGKSATFAGDVTISKSTPVLKFDNLAGGGLDPSLTATGTNFTISTSSITPLSLSLSTGDLTLSGSNDTYVLKLDTNNNAISDVAKVVFNDRGAVGWNGSAVFLSDHGSNKDLVLKVGTGNLYFKTNNLTRVTIADTTGDATFTGHVLPAADSTKNLGSDAKRWAAAYVDSLSATLTATISGDLRIQSDLSVLNKAQTAYIDVATRDTSGSEVVYNLSNLGTATFAGNVLPATDGVQTLGGSSNRWGALELKSGGQIQWQNGDARIIEGLVNNYSLSFQTYDSSTTTLSTALRLDGNNIATFSGYLKLSGPGDATARQIHFLAASGESNTEAMRITRYQDKMYFTYGENAGDEAFWINSNGTIQFEENVTFASHAILNSGKYLEFSAMGKLINMDVSAWSNASEHNILYSGWTSSTGDYLSLKVAGNGTTNHGNLIVGDNLLSYGRMDSTTSAQATDSSTNPHGDDQGPGFIVTNTGNATFAGNVSLAATKKLYLDGGTNTYITESSDGVIDFYGDGVQLFTVKQNGTQNEVVVNEGSGDVDFRVEANNDQHAFFVEAEAKGTVGIGVSDPDARLEVIGSTSDDQSYNLRLRSADDQELMYVRNDGIVKVSHNYLYVDNTAGLYSNGIIRARAGVTDDGGTLGLGGNGEVDNLVLTSNTLATFAGKVGMANGFATSKFAVKSSDVHANFDFYNDGTTYLNGTTTVDADLKVTGTNEDSFIIGPQAAGDGTILMSLNAAENAYEPLRLDVETFKVTASGGTSPCIIETSGLNTIFGGKIGLGGATSPSRLLHIDNTSSTDTAAAYIYTNAIHTGTTTQAHLSVRSDHADSTGHLIYGRGDGTGDLFRLDKGSSDQFSVTHSGNIKARGYLNLMQGYGSAYGIYLYGNPAMWREDVDNLRFPLDVARFNEIVTVGNQNSNNNSSGAPGRYATGILDLSSGSNMTASGNNFRIETNIPFNSSGADFTVVIEGFRYGDRKPVHLTICWHIYPANTPYNHCVISHGGWSPVIKMARNTTTNNVTLLLETPGYWPKMYVKSLHSSNYEVGAYAKGWTWANGTLASGYDIITTIPYQALSLGNGGIVNGGAITATSFTGDGSNLTNLPAQSAPSNMVTTDTTQTISGAKTFTNVGNTFNGHLYYSAYDTQGQHYPHFRDGSANNGADINWRHYYGSSYKTHQWTSDSSGNMAQIFQGRIEAVGELKGTSLDINGAADISGNLTVGGDLNITGDINSTSVTNLDVDDKTITVAKGAADSAAADGAGIVIDGAAASLLYDHTGTQWEFNKPVEVKVGSSAITFTEHSNGATIWLDGADGDFIGGDYFNISAYGTTQLAFGYGAASKMTMSNGGALHIESSFTVQNALAAYYSTATSATTTTTIASVNKTTYGAAFFDYVVYKSTNIRAGTITACNDGTNVSFAETSTTDLGDTSDVTFAVDIDGSQMRLRATTTSSTWTIKTIVRAI